jgi:hypothetical protein
MSDGAAQIIDAIPGHVAHVPADQWPHYEMGIPSTAIGVLTVFGCDNRRPAVDYVIVAHTAEAIDAFQCRDRPGRHAALEASARALTR